MSRRGIRSIPNDAMVVTKYSELDEFVRAFVFGHFGFVIVIGDPGLQKSRVVRDAVGDDCCWIEGNTTAYGMFATLWHRRDETVVIDDVDELFRDRASVRLLKSLCQTEERKVVAWNTKAPDRDDIPRRFETSSRTIIIANEWATVSKNVAAVEDRGHVVIFDPPAIEVHLRTARWFWDQEVFDFIAANLHRIERASMRMYLKAWERKDAGLAWKTYLESSWLQGTTAVVARLVEDPSHRTEEERVAAFMDETGLCRATYYNHKKKLAMTPTDVRPIKLVNTEPPYSDGRPFDLEKLLKGRHGKLGNG